MKWICILGASGVQAFLGNRRRPFDAVQFAMDAHPSAGLDRVYATLTLVACEYAGICQAQKNLRAHNKLEV